MMKTIDSCGTGELYGYTSSIVTIKQGNTLFMYDERGTQKGNRSC